MKIRIEPNKILTKGSVDGMKEPIRNNKLLKVLFSLLVIGSAAAAVKIYQTTKHIELSLESAPKEDDSAFFV